MSKRNTSSKSKKRNRTAQNTAVRAAVIEQGMATQARLNAINEGIKEIAKRRAQYQNLPTPNRAGFIAEELHNMSFNANAASARMDLSAKVPQGNPAHDISILRGADEVTVQVIPLDPRRAKPQPQDHEHTEPAEAR